MKPVMKFIILFMIRTMMTPALAQLHIGVGISIGPPAPVHEEIVIVKPHPNAVWIPGFYQWLPKHRTYSWVKGHWDRPPHAHMVWVPGRWGLRNKEWVFYRGRWERERREHR
jgi:hypothetical protein